MLVRLNGNQVAAEGVSDKVVTSAGGNAGVITVTAIAERRHILHKLVWSYSDTPTNGGITISGGNVTLDIDIVNPGPGSLSINYLCSVNTNLVVTIKAGGGAVVGKLYIEHTLQP